MDNEKHNKHIMLYAIHKYFVTNMELSQMCGKLRKIMTMSMMRGAMDGWMDGWTDGSQPTVWIDADVIKWSHVYFKCTHTWLLDLS